jgi:hypothetical protein
VTWWSWDNEGRLWRPTTTLADGFDVAAQARLVPLRAGRWALLSRGPASVNGRPCLPLHVLADRDEVAVGGRRFCISLTSQAEVVSFRATSRRVRCARCLGVLQDGDEIVECPRCRTHRHSPCWAYDTICQTCGFTTGAASWTPDPLE